MGMIALEHDYIIHMVEWVSRAMTSGSRRLYDQGDEDQVLWLYNKMELFSMETDQWCIAEIIEKQHNNYM